MEGRKAIFSVPNCMLTISAHYASKLKRSLQVIAGHWQLSLIKLQLKHCGSGTANANKHLAATVRRRKNCWRAAFCLAAFCTLA